MWKKVLVKLKTLLFSMILVSNWNLDVEKSELFNKIHAVFNIASFLLYTVFFAVKLIALRFYLLR